MYAQVILAWSLYMLVASIRLVLPWETCGNAWNSPNCTTGSANVKLRCESLNSTATANSSLLTSAASAIPTISQRRPHPNLVTNNPMLTLFSFAANTMPVGSSDDFTSFGEMSGPEADAARFARSTSSALNASAGGVAAAHEWVLLNSTLNCTNVTLEVRSPAEEYF